MKKLGKRFARFFVTGAVGFIIDGGILMLLVYALGMDAVLARYISIPIAITGTWWINRHYAFADRRSARALPELLRYFIANGLGALLNMLVYLVLLKLEIKPFSHPALAFTIASVVAMFFNFTVNYLKVFNANRKRLLLLNGSHSEIPLIAAAKKLGFYVITTGNEPDLIGHQYADEYHAVDYSDKDAVLRLARKLDIAHICSCANDFGAITAAYVAEKMNLPGHDSHDTALLLHHKDRFKQFSLKHHLPTPYAECFDGQSKALAAVERLSFPLIIKPIDLTGGKGVAKVTDQQEYTEAIIKAFELSREKRVLVEAFFIGDQYSFSTFLVNQKVIFYFSDNEYSYKNPYYVSTSAAPAVDVALYADSLVQAVEKTAAELGLVDGIFHIQYLANGEQANIIDITRRCSGDLYPYPVNYSTDADWAYWIVRAEAGLDVSGFPDIEQTGFCGRHCIMSGQNGVVSDVIIDDKVKPYIYEDLFWWQPGDVIDNYLVQKVGMVFLNFSSMEEMLSITKQLPELIQVQMQ